MSGLALLRHGVPAGYREGYFCGRTDVELSEGGLGTDVASYTGSKLESHRHLAAETLRSIRQGAGGTLGHRV